MQSHRYLRGILAGLNDIEEWRLGDAALARAKGYPREFPADVLDDWGLLFLDVVIEAGSGDLVCHEVNGSNGVGTDALTGDSRFRAENEASQTAQRVRDYGYLDAHGRLKHPVVALHAHQHWRFFRTGGEFFPRVDHYASCIDSALPGHRVALRGASEPLGEEDIAVVFGDVTSVADALIVDPETRRFMFRGRPVVFIGNPNLIAELVRVGRLTREGRRYAGADLRVVHGSRLTETIHDKGLQQSLLRRTGIRPLDFFEAWTPEQAVRQTQAMLQRSAVVLKPNAGSGGTGIRAVVPGMSDAEIKSAIDFDDRRLPREVRRQYRADGVSVARVRIRSFDRLSDGRRRPCLGFADRRAVRAGQGAGVSRLAAHRARTLQRARASTARAASGYRMSAAAW